MSAEGGVFGIHPAENMNLCPKSVTDLSEPVELSIISVNLKVGLQAKKGTHILAFTFTKTMQLLMPG